MRFFFKFVKSVNHSFDEGSGINVGINLPNFDERDINCGLKSLDKSHIRFGIIPLCPWLSFYGNATGPAGTIVWPLMKPSFLIVELLF